ncbi:preprotein translocase subunit SecY [Clostridium tyrobutyricum]|uniref:Protein translocase subunit SecY n=1 Tax=Clostridium tyrobutyricum DIVETGP TaxID=1408889 RepID=W6N395_CLOTY|nr:preprotein translocase subunit SecY [Clostridium tyrobutyricum]AND86108.1 protein translocase subunit SecY [Clostridium tyrobutyricum]ANP70606.1 preprotein translocase subunit SecY [Clostridium tyrobutyricum]MBR9648071.1 preprotein translocase subunit SecY [Clostridium tyrobutyricum]MBV4416818.1 preprotein translocase subunit SecY [Clostridium tyrobutyricum]MBV4422223.1 preprotein translocase subunit SecY [Clostridium tyrobutyricum]
MIATLRNAWKAPEIRKRLLFTLFMIVIFRMGNFIPVPGIDTAKLASLTKGGSLINFYDLISGGALSRFSIFAMGVVPFINSSIIMQLLTVAVPRLEQLSKEGEEGRKKIQEYTRYASVPLGIIQGFSIYAIIASAGALVDPSNKLNMFIIILTVTTASTFLMWFGDKITEHGIGNGVSLIIFINIISRFPSTMSGILKLQQTQIVNFVEVIGFLAIIVVLFVAVVVMSLSERRIPIQYAGKTAGGRMYKGQSTHIPINVNGSAVIGIIFAISVMQFPMTIGQFWPNSSFYKFVMTGSFSPFKQSSWEYALLYFLLTIFFTWFYTQVTMKPEEMAENMNKSSGFIPGIRPGEPTAVYIEKVLTKVAILGGGFAGIIAIAPIVGEAFTNFKGIYFGGTGLLIIVNVAIETMRQIESQLVMRHYHGFLK